VKIALTEPVVWDEDVEGIEIGRTDDGQFIVHVIKQLFTYRVTMTPVRTKSWYVTGWCYHDEVSACLAVVVWSRNDDPCPANYIRMIPPLGGKWPLESPGS
jgi:hypothetical protein